MTGGGSGGHVMPALTVVRALRESSSEVQISAIGSYNGIEASLFRDEGLPYKAISTGKLRRYLSWENFTDLFRLARGLWQAYWFLLRFSRKDTVVFGTGGFVIVPVVLAAWLQGKKIVLHEQTSRVGLANKIASFFAKKVLITFSSSQGYFPKEKTIHSGYPLRKEIMNPPSLKSFSKFPVPSDGRPIIFVTGGGNGSYLLNKVLDDCREELVKKYFVVHQCGAKFFEEYKIKESENYKVFDFINTEMVSLLNEADVVISRAGAGTVVELISLGKPSIFIPLKIAQKNEQFHNAKEAEKRIGSIVIEEDHLNQESLMEAILNIKDIARKEKVTENPTEQICKELRF